MNKLLFLIAVVLFLLMAATSIDAKGQKVINHGYGDYLLVPGGRFRMGDNFYEGNSDEIPVHTVYLDEYYIGKYKVTNEEYKKFIDDKGYTTPAYWSAGGYGKNGKTPEYWKTPAYKGGGIPGNKNYPVVGVSWFEAMAYCKWLSKKTRHAYRLPTEAQWEKAVRSTDQRRYAWGNTIDETFANYDNGGDRAKKELKPVGYYDGSNRGGFKTNNNASPYGAYDMIGNITEWCYDWYERDYYRRSPGKNPRGPGSGRSRVLRSGGYVDSAYYQRAAGRHKKGAHFKNYKTGFRCVIVKSDPPIINDGYGDYLLVKEGTIRMGDNFNEGDADEIPVHTVYTDTFYIGKYKISNNQYKKFLLDDGYKKQKYWKAGGFGKYGSAPRYWYNKRFRSGAVDGNGVFPVVGINWFEAMAYCAWLSEKTGAIYRLPYEAEWEKAARGADQRRFAWGNKIDGRYANFEHSGGPYERGITPLGFYDGKTHNGFATRLNASPYGALDMIGNVWEWCYDWYGGSNYYKNSPVNNPKGPETGGSRVLRAGGWVDSAYYQRAANRNGSFPANRNPIQGFRCVREK
jgi:formylglycine-generating enzyme required for sulfatase activity